MNKLLNFSGDPNHGYGYGSDPDRIRIVTLLRRALAVVCTVAVLLVRLFIILSLSTESA